MAGLGDLITQLSPPRNAKEPFNMFPGGVPLAPGSNPAAPPASAPVQAPPPIAPAQAAPPTPPAATDTELAVRASGWDKFFNRLRDDDSFGQAFLNFAGNVAKPLAPGQNFIGSAIGAVGQIPKDIQSANNAGAAEADRLAGTEATRDLQKAKTDQINSGRSDSKGAVPSTKELLAQAYLRTGATDTIENARIKVATDVNPQEFIADFVSDTSNIIFFKNKQGGVEQAAREALTQFETLRGEITGETEAPSVIPPEIQALSALEVIQQSKPNATQVQIDAALKRPDVIEHLRNRLSTPAQ